MVPAILVPFRRAGFEKTIPRSNIAVFEDCIACYIFVRHETKNMEKAPLVIAVDGAMSILALNSP